MDLLKIAFSVENDDVPLPCYLIPESTILKKVCLFKKKNECSNLVTPGTVEPRNAFQAYYLLPEKTFLQKLRIEFDIPPIDPGREPSRMG